MGGGIDRSGFWIDARRWEIGYWAPRAFKPLSVRHGQPPEVRKGWWGVLRVVHHDEPQGGVSG
jgi:hypothetical protein